MEQTLVLLKPDCVQRHLIGTVIAKFESKGLRIVGLKMVQADEELAARHYAVHQDKPFYNSLLTFLTSGPTVAIALAGNGAVQVVRNLMGPTDGTTAPPATIRGDFALSIQNNLVHGSDSLENAAKEIKLWFKDKELLDYQMVTAPWVAGRD